MIDKGKISSLQLAVLMYPLILATSVLSVPSVTMRFAGHDMWMSPLWAIFIGLLAIYIAYRLNVRYPSLSPIQSSVLIAGKIPGKLCGLYFLLYMPHLNGVVVREYGEFVLSTILPGTPLYVVMGSLLFVCAINARSGIEVIGRSGIILVALTVIFLFVILLLLIPELYPDELLPIAEKGLKPSLLGAIAPASWLSEFAFLAFLLPFVSDRSRALKASVYSLIAITITMLAVNIVCLFLFGI
ncbi:hypothetical protein D3H35_18875 [Cohnella faecalis]|uniref:Uncharacterized protein n=1 Tax=Cohnella faecalis TaxID=2315694 RepID=A0A398CUP3_9BACL|nr:hypothetical protein D3H35_18875 [Cohnella faecalis]